jgi:hypothetical protein
MGSSRAWVHINPISIMDSTGYSAYNIGLDGQKIPLQLARYNSLTKYNKEPKVIIYSLDLFMFNREKGIYTTEQFLPYLMYNSAIESSLITYHSFDYFDYRIPLIRYTGQTDALLHTVKITLYPKSNKNGRVLGFLGMKKKWGNDFEVAKSQMNHYSSSVDSTIVDSFNSFLQNCQQKNIKIIFVYTPEFHEGQNFVQNRNIVMSQFYKLSKKYNIPFLDYSDDSISYNKDYFYNVSHLNAEGADLFSKKLASDIKRVIN